MEIYGNEMADQLAMRGSSHPLIEPELAHGMSGRVARVVIRHWVRRTA